MNDSKNNSTTTVLIGGCFDLIHVGHLHLIKGAKALGDRLCVAVLSDRHVRSYKGPERPVQPEGERLEMVKGVTYLNSSLFRSDSTRLKNLAGTLCAWTGNGTA